jgi:exodeoxyribonuclease VII large subunit
VAGGGLEARFRGLLLRTLEVAWTRLEELARRPCFRRPLERLREQERRLDDLEVRLGRAVQQRLVQALQRLEGQAARLEALSPLRVLQRGYSLTRTERQQIIVRRRDQVRPGERLVTTVGDGQIISRVEEERG